MVLAGFHEYLFLHPADDNSTLRSLGREVLQGRCYDPHLETTNFSKILDRRLLIVKDVFAHLAAREIYKQSEKIRPVLLVRNPYAVTLSLRTKRDWAWPSDPSAFLSQQVLVEQFLRPYEKLIRDTAAKGSYLDCQMLIWCIVNYVPLKQFASDQLLVTFYEDWLSDPNRELGRVHDFLGLPRVGVDIRQSEKFTRSSQSSSKSSFDKMSWKDQLTEAEMASGRAILEVFGFDQLYDKDASPNSRILSEIRGN